jgi:peptidoglycan/LPS O-acetylase OafA/YrhL
MEICRAQETAFLRRSKISGSLTLPDKIFPMYSGQPSPIIRPHMPELDSVRGIAILLVLFLHGMARPLNAELSHGGDLILAISGYGGVGVNLFFVLSGFLITGILVNSRSNPDYYRRFYTRRALRILPAFYATLLLLMLGGWIGWRFFLASILFLANSANLVGVAIQYGPFWSLAVEEHFYMFWPLVVRRSSSRLLVIILAIIVAGTPPVRAITAMFANYPQQFMSLYTWCNLDGIALGALLAVWLRLPSFERKQLSVIALPLLIVGSSSFAFLVSYPRAEAAFLGTACNLACAGLLSSMLLMGTTRWSFLVHNSVLKFFGFISYGLYLIHVLAFKLVETIFAPAFALLTSAGMPTAAMLLRFCTGSVLAIGVAYLSRRSLEEKFLREGYASSR